MIIKTANPVAPLAGAWIETSSLPLTASSISSHPLRVRGLKLIEVCRYDSRSESHPLRVRGLKLVVIIQAERYLMSHPLRVRGLKRTGSNMSANSASSHPLRVRGLKRRSYPTSSLCYRVAPLAGAWIETIAILSQSAFANSRTPCGCVD